MFKLSFFGSFDGVHRLPFSGGEVCFIGRSNAGKSTILNAIFGQKLAKTSKTPGRTLGINMFRVENNPLFVVDLPGYGFAKVGKDMLNKLHFFVPDYLKKRKSLKKVYVIVDAKVGFTKLDIDAVNILKEAHVPFMFIFNKIDKVPPAKLDAFAKMVSDTQEEDFCFICAKKPNVKVISNLQFDIKDSLGVK